MTLTTSHISDRIWAEVKLLPEFRAADVAAHGVNEQTARSYIRRWETMGRIRLVRRDEKNRSYFRSIDYPVTVPEPVSGEATPEGNMWRAMRRIAQFSPIDIAAHANVGEVSVSVDKARAYCRQLVASRHIRVRQTAIPGVREPLYQLIEDTGPRPPRQARVTGVLDPNTGIFTPANPELRG